MDFPVNRKLVADLANLIARYKSGDLENLARCLRDREFMLELAGIVEQIGQAKKAQAKKRTGTRQAPNSRRLEHLKELDRDKFDLLVDFGKQLQSGEILSSVRSIRIFAQDLGLKFAPNISRRDLVPSVLSHLAKMPISEIRALLERSSPSERDDAAEYQKWAELILRSKHSGGNRP